MSILHMQFITQNVDISYAFLGGVMGSCAADNDDKGCAKKMRSPKIIGTILTPLEWSYSFHIKTRKKTI